MPFLLALPRIISVPVILHPVHASVNQTNRPESLVTVFQHVADEEKDFIFSGGANMCWCRLKHCQRFSIFLRDFRFVCNPYAREFHPLPSDRWAFDTAIAETNPEVMLIGFRTMRSWYPGRKNYEHLYYTWYSLVYWTNTGLSQKALELEIQRTKHLNGNKNG